MKFIKVLLYNDVNLPENLLFLLRIRLQLFMKILLTLIKNYLESFIFCLIFNINKNLFKRKIIIILLLITDLI